MANPTCRGARLTRETKILHQGGIKFTRELFKNHQVPRRSKFHQPTWSGFTRSVIEGVYVITEGILEGDSGGFRC